MILTAHQPTYLPWLGLFHKVAIADRFISFDQVQYLPKDWNSRNRIKTATGPTWLTVPVHRRDHRTKALAEIEIDNSVPWARKHLRSLEMNYTKSPHFHRYVEFFRDVYSRRWDHLVELNDHMLAYFLDVLGISTPVESAASHEFVGHKSDLVLDMCRQLGASAYIFGELGRDYADVAQFRAAGVVPYFQQYKHPVYPQRHGEFVSHLSVVDLLANCGEDSLETLMSGNLTRAELERAVAR